MSAGRYGKQISATTQVKTGLTKLSTVLVSSTTSGTYTIYDSDKASTSDPLVVATVTPNANTQLLYKNLVLKNGLYVVVANTLQITVVYE